MMLNIVRRNQLLDPRGGIQAGRVVTRIHPYRGFCPGYAAEDAQVALSLCGGVPGCG